MVLNDAEDLRKLLDEFDTADHKVAVRFVRGTPPRYGYRYPIVGVEFERGPGGTPFIVLTATAEKTT